MGYTPLFDSILSGSLHGRWPHNGVWALLLSRVSREGLIDEHPRALAAAIGIPEAMLMECIQDFCSQDIHSRSQECDGRKLELIDPNRPWGWKVVNHSKYKEKARKRNYDQTRTESGQDAARKRAERAANHDVPTRPDASRAVPLSSPTPTPSPVLKSATDVASRREEAKALWPRVLAAIQVSELQKSFPSDGDVQRVIRQLGGWQKLGSKHRDLRGQTEQQFLNAYAALQAGGN